jgi:peptidyl-dipeptidase Dcp
MRKTARYAKEIYRASAMVNAEGDYDNHAIIMEMVRLRQDRAEMLGYKNFAEMILQGKMAGSADAVMDFLKKTGDVYRPAAEKDLADVRALAAKKDQLNDLQPWDFGFYSQKLQIERFALDEEQTRPYFQLEDVLKGLREHVEKLFNVDMVETKDKYPVYHPDVKVYEIKDKADGSVIGLFYADYYKRQGKLENAAWSTSYRDGHVENGQKVIPVVTNVCSFDKPLPGQPSLLTMDDIRTVFHEFGHGLHALLSKARYTSLAGTHVKRDFVELPSQVQENWGAAERSHQNFRASLPDGRSHAG